MRVLTMRVGFESSEVDEQAPTASTYAPENLVISCVACDISAEFGWLGLMEEQLHVQRHTRRPWSTWQGAAHADFAAQWDYYLGRH